MVLSRSAAFVVAALAVTAAAHSNGGDDVIRSRAASTTCKLPADALPAAEVAALNATLGGRLLSPTPLAAPCHPGRPEYSPATCSFLQQRWNLSSIHAEHPTSVSFQNWAGFSCLPNATATCSAAGFPTYVVNATTTAHVQAAVDFARRLGVRLNIKNTGHDYGGRSGQPRSLSIWTHFLNQTQWHVNGYTLQGACAIHLPEPHLTAGSGAQIADIYKESDKYNLTFVGGAHPTVGLGGHLTGSGHGALSPLLGMATDQIVEAEIVTADGKVVIANECQNQDLFFAVRGGGGSTFGVVTKFVLRVHPNIPFAMWTGALFSNTSDTVKPKAIAHIFKRFTEVFSPLNASAYINGPLFASTDVVYTTFIVPYMNETGLKVLFEPILAEGRAIMKQTKIGGWFPNTPKAYFSGPRWPGIPNVVVDTEPGFEDIPWAGTGGAKILTSWLWDAGATLNISGTETALLKGFTDPDALLVANWVGGAGLANPPYLRGGPTSVHPAWRKMLVRPSVQIDYPGPSDAATIAAKQRTLAAAQPLLVDVAPSMGTYVNEADALSPNFASDFWGSNYARLLEIKKAVDPTQVFWCQACVGSEGWQATQDGQLCKVA